MIESCRDSPPVICSTFSSSFMRASKSATRSGIARWDCGKEDCQGLRIVDRYWIGTELPMRRKGRMNVEQAVFILQSLAN
jgi:hypothetical protein